MTRRRQLTEAQTAALFDPSTDPREMVRHYTLTSADIAMVRNCRGDHNELRVCAARSRRGSSVERTRGCWHPHRAHKSLWKFHLMAAAKACWRSVASRRWKLGHALNARSAGASAPSARLNLPWCRPWELARRATLCGTNSAARAMIS